MPAILRRRFLRSAAASFAYSAMGAYGLELVHQKPRRVGLIGCGGRGTGAATQALRADKQAVLWAMGDVFADRLEGSQRALQREFGEAAGEKIDVPMERRFTGIDNYRKVIDSGVDVVILTSYPNFRPMHLKAAVEAGKHVFAEKPVAVDAVGLRSVMESARKAKEKNLACMVGFCWRYNDGMRATFERIAAGDIGDVVSVHTTYHAGTLGKNPRRPEWSDAEFMMRNWWHFTWLSGDHIVEQAVHSVDRMAWAMGDRTPKLVNCLGGRAARTGEESGNVYDHFAAIFEYEGGVRCHHTCRQIDRCPGDNSDYVYGTKGWAVINGWTPTYLLRTHSGEKIWEYSGESDRDMYQTEHDELFASIRAGTPINDCERGARSSLMAIMARMAAYTGQTVRWDDAMNSKEDLMPPVVSFDAPLPMPEIAVPGKTRLV